MADCVFFYGTLMAGFDNRRSAGVERFLTFTGRASIEAALFDLGPYPAAIPDRSAQVWGELYDLTDPAPALKILDDVEEFDPDAPDASLYVRVRVAATLAEHGTRQAWVYFYNRSVAGVRRVLSGDYLQHLNSR